MNSAWPNYLRRASSVTVETKDISRYVVHIIYRDDSRLLFVFARFIISARVYEERDSDSFSIYDALATNLPVVRVYTLVCEIVRTFVSSDQVGSASNDYDCESLLRTCMVISCDKS